MTGIKTRRLKQSFCGVVSFTSACFTADWMTLFLLVLLFSFHNYMNDRSDQSIKSNAQRYKKHTGISPAAGSSNTHLNFESISASGPISFHCKIM